MPFFSVLMPTRNRASLLRSALKTAVNQEFQDYEIIVSDNNSIDDTRIIVEDFMKSSDKIKYVNPGRDLSMCDNWEYVLDHAAGRYIVYLCDDDALAPNSLSYIHELLTHFQINALVWRYSGYNHPDIPDEKLRYLLSYDHASGKLFEVASKPMMDALCRFDASVNGIVPRMLNCTVSKEAIDACRRRTGTFFIPPYPDFASVGQLLSTNSSYHLIDLPLYVAGASRVSNAGIRFDRKKKIDEYISLFGRDLLEGVPYQMRYLTTSYFYATWLLFQRTYPETFTSEIDVEAYLKALFTELTWFEDHEDVSEEFELLSSYMRNFSGSDELFQRLWQEHRQAKMVETEQRNPTSPLRRAKQMAWNLIGRNKRAFNLLARARGHQIISSSFKNVPSIDVASKILSDYLAKQARPMREMNPIQVSSHSFMKE